jgi:cobalt/nickel transport system permease protein
MHIPDGILALPVSLTLDALAVPAIGWAARRVTAGETDFAARIPLVGVMGAFVFAAQMINVPIGFGASSHLVGGALLAAVLGPATAVLVLTAVLALQAIVFQDGGVIALGANIWNMALAGVIVAYLPTWLWGRRPWTLFCGGLLSVLASGMLAIGQLAASGVPVGQLFWIAVALFAVAGVLEGAITVAAFRAIARLSPEAVITPARASFRARVCIAATAALLVTVGAAFASTAPDGLTQMAGQLGLAPAAVWSAPLAGYTFSSLGPDWIARPAAGLCGLACLLGVVAIRKKR